MTARECIGLLASGATLALCFASAAPAQAGYRNGTFYVHKKPVTLVKTGQICCNPVVTFYDAYWGHTRQGSLHWSCRRPHAIVAGAEPAINEPRNVHKGRAWFVGCQGKPSQAVHFLRLRD